MTSHHTSRRTGNSHAWFVEAVGLAAETDGFTRIGGRLFGLLLLADHPRSLDQLAVRLGVSKASVSTDTRRLLDSGVIERVGRAGDRRAFYQIAPDFFARLVARRVARWTRFAELVGELRRRSPKARAAVGTRLREVERVHARIVERIATAVDDRGGRRPVRRGARPSRRGAP